MLVRGLPSFGGQVTTAMVDGRVDVGRGLEASLNDTSWRLSVRCAESPAVEGQRQQSCALILRSGAVRQTLFTYRSFFSEGQRIWASERPPTVLWAGDLDLDGGLDILLDTSDHYNVTEMRLFLSSAVQREPLPSEVARFTHTGC
jgi:hypothetical protein